MCCLLFVGSVCCSLLALRCSWPVACLLHTVCCLLLKICCACVVVVCRLLLPGVCCLLSLLVVLFFVLRCGALRALFALPRCFLCAVCCLLFDGL